MCFLLTALAAFADSSHAPMMRAGLVPKLVMLCRTEVSTTCGMCTHVIYGWVTSTAPAPVGDLFGSRRPTSSTIAARIPHAHVPSKCNQYHTLPTPYFHANTQVSQMSVETGSRAATLQTRAAAVLRNLAHNQRNHAVLIQAGAVDPLVDIMRSSTVGCLRPCVP